MRRALIVGINDYQGAPLSGSVQDACQMQRVLSRNADGSANFSCRVLTAPPRQVTRSFLRSEIGSLFGAPADIALFHFSGHGQVTNLGGVIVTQDATKYDEGISMYEVLALANQSPVSEVVVTLDCCHSGAFGEIPSFSGTEVFLREGISVIAASRRQQQAMEDIEGGVFTRLVVDALEGGAAGILGNVTAASVYTHLDAALGAWEQRPLFKSHVSRFVTLRSCQPRVEVEVLQLLPRLFGAADGTTPHEGMGGELCGEADWFGQMRMLERVGLVESVAEVGENARFRLTGLGQYYRRLVIQGRI